jgi:hypothetical protein
MDCACFIWLFINAVTIALHSVKQRIGITCDAGNNAHS